MVRLTTDNFNFSSSRGLCGMQVQNRSTNDLLFANFNQDYSYVVLHLYTKSSLLVVVYLLAPKRDTESLIANPLENVMQNVCSEIIIIRTIDYSMLVRGVADGGIGIVEMLFCTSLVALVGAGEQPAFSPRRIQLVNTKVRSQPCALNTHAC
jgi:hypothetical protein